MAREPSDFEAYLDHVKHPLDRIHISLAITGAGLLVSVVLMWAINSFGYDWLRVLNFGIAAIGFWGLWFFGLRPTHLILSGGLGGLFALLTDSDKSQGITTGPLWLYRVLRVIVFGYSLAAVTLLTWSFKEAPMAFWLAFFCALVLLLWVQVFKVKPSRLVSMLIGAYLVITPVVGLWQIFGPAYNGGAFDPCNGKSLYMVDPLTNEIVGKYKPTKCQKPYPYSSISGKAVVNMSAEQAIARSPKSTAGYAVQTVTKAVANPEWKSLSTLAIIGGLVLVGLFVFNKKARGTISGNLVPVLIVGGLAVGGYMLYNNQNIDSSAMKCSENVIQLEPGGHLTVNAKCPTYVDQERMKNGVTYYLADEVLRCKHWGQKQSLVAHSMIFDQTGKESDRFKVAFIPNQARFEQEGLPSVELVVFPVEAPLPDNCPGASTLKK